MQPYFCPSWNREKLWSDCVTSQIPGSMTAAELSCEILDRRKIPVKDKEYWSCWEVSDKEEMGESDGETREEAQLAKM